MSEQNPNATSTLASPGGFVRTLGQLPRRLYDWVLHWADTPHAVAALSVLAFAEASFFPVPPDVLLIAMCLKARKRAFAFAAICTAASVVGGLLGYYIGFALWDSVSGWFFAHVPGVTPEAFEKVKATYETYGIPVVFTAGFTPIPFKLFTIASGVMTLQLLPFLGAALVGRAGRFFLVAGLIYWFGEPIKTFIDKYFNLLAVAFTLLLLAGFAVIKLLL